LAGAAREIESVYRHFKGKKHTKAKATESNFRSALKEPVVFHLAMHAIPDTVNSRFSYMLFNSANDKVNDGKLHNYEISLLRINSPMVVLSACNSGTGTLYRSEGLMSLARSFTLAGAASVVMTVREVNDETSEAIISRYYYYLAKGRRKNEAMHSAKLDFLNDNLPSLKNPYYWSAYEVVGDTTPVVTRRPVLIVIAFFSVLLSTGFVIDHFRRRRIFSDRSL
jgi:CHAT domain-containing protein